MRLKAALGNFIMSIVYFITHPEVVIDPGIPIESWSLSEVGILRMQKMLRNSWVQNIKSIHSSTEKKAIDGAEILANFLGQKSTAHKGLCENDRSSTGYLPKVEFESVADQFFAKPSESIRGWETAQYAQKRVVFQVENIINSTPVEHPIAIVSHGAVGTLLLCKLGGLSIDRKHDQPGSGGGNYFGFKKKGLGLLHGWEAIDAK